MTVLDYAVLITIGLSVLLSVIRGLVREVLALLAWVAAIAAAALFGDDLAGLMPAEIHSVELRMLAGFAAVFFVVLLLMSLLAMVVSRLVKGAGLGVEDRILGGVFGLARGLLVVVVLVLLAGLTALPKQPAWRDALLRPPLETLAVFVKGWMPADLAKHISYN